MNISINTNILILGHIKLVDPIVGCTSSLAIHTANKQRLLILRSSNKLTIIKTKKKNRLPIHQACYTLCILLDISFSFPSPFSCGQIKEIPCISKDQLEPTFVFDIIRKCIQTSIKKTRIELRLVIVPNKLLI